MLDKILVANRGEIACRVMRTARRLGVRTVAVYSEADAGARHVEMADEAYCIGPAAARESYLNGERIVQLAQASGAVGIHPGYGFLSENADFATACGAAGVVFIGPPAAAIRAMGDKSRAKARMREAGVPLVPGYHGEDQAPERLAAEADAMGYPVLIKASAGGGGKGMRIVPNKAEFASALESCQRESASAFGDTRVLLERYLQRPRHIEIQVFADTHGNVIHLFERDCSVQRRHQKVLEEAPAPGMSAERRRAMGAAAVAAARAVGYVGAGTVEFIATADGAFCFMEMNTRLQVEHPVTEMITGLDLVEWQLRVASGEPLPLRQEDLELSGHALEVRLYAEDPARGFLPSIGTLHHLQMPRTGPHVRIDSGVRQGDSITPYYDPMIAKLIVWDRTRDLALARLRAALAACEIAGVSTNVEFLGRLAANASFVRADLDTGLIERERADLLPEAQPVPDQVLAVATLADVLDREAAVAAQAHGSGDPYSPWDSCDGWRMNEDNHRILVFRDGERHAAVTLHYRNSGYEVELPHHGRSELSGSRSPDGRIQARLGTASLQARVVVSGTQIKVFWRGHGYSLEAHDPMLHEFEAEVGGGSLTAPMPGKVIALMVEPGGVVAKGMPLLIMEAMKMEHTITAPGAGTVAAVLYRVGDQVAEGAELVRFAHAAASDGASGLVPAGE